MVVFPEYESYDGLGLAELVRNGEVSPAELVETVLDRIERRNGPINAVIRRLDAQACQQAKSPLPAGPLSGVPTLIKDLSAEVQGVPTGNACRLYQDFIPKRDTETISRYRQAGLLFVGKTATPELGLYPFTESEAYGVTRNPWSLEHTPGGSSGGAAAAVAAGIVPFAHASDGGGSIRIPASNCGLFGLKPSRGRAPAGPNFAEDLQGMAGEHVITRSVRDSAAMLDVISAGDDPGDLLHCPPPPQSFLESLKQPPPRLKVALSFQPPLGGALHPDCRHAAELTAHQLEALGHYVEEARPELPSPEAMNDAIVTIFAGELAALVRRSPQRLGRRATYRDFEAATWAMARYGEQLSAGQFVRAREFMLSLGRLMATFHQRYDVLVCPVLNQPPALIGSLAVSVADKTLSRVMIGILRQDWTLPLIGIIEANSLKILQYMGWPTPYNMSGQPAMSVPLYWNTQNLPIGTQVVGRYGEETTLLQLAQELEQAMPWFDKLAPLAY
jgi:amidase